jgi:HD superfamily phosphodiesterase
MKVKDIYAQYKITPSLQAHMVQVAGLAKLIMDNWKDTPEINVRAVLQACLFHDIAKILSFKTFKDNEEMLQAEFIKKYGDDEHAAANKIVEEVGLSGEAQEIIKKNNTKPFLEKIRQIMESNDFEMKILKYADSRVAPQGLVTLKGRWDELLQRRPEKEGDREANEIMTAIEKQIQNVVIMNLADIKQADIDTTIDFLNNLEI